MFFLPRIGFLVLLLFFFKPTFLHSAKTPEQETKRISEFLKPIPNDIWKQIAGEKINLEYEVVKGDTLYDISKRLFGDPKYWPKIWSINNGKIVNPHIIVPGIKVAFLSGTGSTLPSISIANAQENQDQPKQPDRSIQWKKLPKQPWEADEQQKSGEIDPYGFDKNSVIKFTTEKGILLKSIVSEEEIAPLGKIVGSKSGAEFLTIEDLIYIEASSELQIGETYVVTTEPYGLKGRRSKRKGYSYINLGQVKILNVRDGIFIGKVIQASDFFLRGVDLILSPGRIKQPTLIAGPRALEANIKADIRVHPENLSQFTQVYIDRGVSDGITPGMVFRTYQHYDPVTEEQITASDFIIHTDFVVIHTTDKWSIATILNSAGIVYDDTRVVLLTDISDLVQQTYGDVPTTEEIDKELDELDRLDAGTPLGREEEKELKQLERWKEEENLNKQDTTELPPPPGTSEETPAQPNTNSEQTPEEPPTAPSQEAQPQNSEPTPQGAPAEETQNPPDFVTEVESLIVDLGEMVYELKD